MSQDSDREVIYVADPCCSWCWGFSPNINGLKEEYEDAVKFTLLLGGLRIGDQHVRTEERKAYIRDTWSRVGALTGQPFNLDVLAQDDVSENTEPACRAAIVMRAMAPDRSFSFMRRLQHAFFVDNRDLSQPDVLADLAAEEDAEGVARDAFHGHLLSEETRQATQAEFDGTRAMGVHGYPTTILRNGDSVKLLAAGYRPMASVRQLFDAWLQQE